MSTDLRQLGPGSRNAKVGWKLFYVLSFCVSTLMSVSAGAAESKSAAKPKTLDAAEVAAFLDRYTDLVKKNYADTLAAAKNLRDKIEGFVKAPSAETQVAAKEAWKAARLSYSKTEAYRFYGGPIDHADTGPEGFINAWPMDESYVDSVKDLPKSGIINDKQKFPKIDKESLRSMNEKDGETNIATGYHAIEFLLWGQDLSATGPGERSYEDFVDGKKDNADRRRQYLQAVTSLLVEDLEKVNSAWQDGSFPKELKAMPPHDAIQKVMTGLTTLSFDEMAGERMMVALEKKDQENEQDCFSDFSLNDLHANQLGILEVWQAADLKKVFLKSESKSVAKISQELSASEKRLKSFTNFTKTFDQMVISKDKKDRQTMEAVIKGLHSQARSLGQMAKVYSLELNVQE